jgi:octaprenyl-diphosphate synthase
MKTTLSDIYQPIQSRLKATDALLVRELSSSNGLLGEMTRYVTRMPGKKIRPALALLGAGLINGSGKSLASPKKAVQLAAAVEMIHTATLLHDDVIDGASLRRGLSTLNAKWGDTLSVLSGDYLYSKAFCVLSGLNHPQVLNLMSDTTRVVCEGEVAQIHHRFNLSLSRADYLKIIQWKTASLMEASAQAGALLGGATPAQGKRLGAFGLNFGLAFQILDDSQDLVGEESAQGKSLGTDLGQGHLTLPFIYLRDVVDAKTRAMMVHWFNGNGKRSASLKPQDRFNLLKQKALYHKVPSYCRKVANRYLAKARTVLSVFPASSFKRSLLALTDYLVRS